jgi:hypothetical protein
MHYVAATECVEVLDTLAWPLVVAGIVLILSTKSGSEAFARILSPMRRVKAFGVEFELGEEQGRRIRASLEEEFGKYREEVESAFSLQAERHDVGRLCATVAHDVIGSLLPGNRDYRCTVYVPDILFKGALYRLIPYYPGGGVVGAVYSERFGIIGRTWRLLESQYEETVPSEQITLITEWGMTPEEALGQEEDRSYLAFLLRTKPHAPPDGILYVEAKKKAFSEDPRKALDADPHVTELAKAVSKVMHQMRGKGPLLRLFEA